MLDDTVQTGGGRASPSDFSLAVDEWKVEGWGRRRLVTLTMTFQNPVDVILLTISGIDMRLLLLRSFPWAMAWHGMA